MLMVLFKYAQDIHNLVVLYFLLLFLNPLMQCMGVMFALHLIVHFLAVTFDPADENVRAKNSPGPLPVFDRTKHAHVIENMHCYICEVDV